MNKGIKLSIKIKICENISHKFNESCFTFILLTSKTLHPI